jgi:hypothetical protein
MVQASASDGLENGMLAGAEKEALGGRISLIDW